MNIDSEIKFNTDIESIMKAVMDGNLYDSSKSQLELPSSLTILHIHFLGLVIPGWFSFRTIKFLENLIEQKLWSYAYQSE